MSFQEAVKSVLNKYADFSGRARRSEYWYWVLAVTIGYVILAILGAILGDAGIYLLIAYALALFVPSVAVTIRRLHDTGRSGWWFLIAFIPFGSIVLLVFEVADSQPGQNAYGPNPKEVTAGGYGGPPTG